MKIDICLVGFGTWGKIIFNNILENKHYNLVLIITSKKKKILNKSRNIKISSNYKDAAKQKNIKDAFISTTPKKQFEISKFFLKNGISLILEKPVSLKLNNIKKLIELNNRYKKIILVNYIYLYHPLILHIKKNIEKNKELIKFFKTKGGDNKPERTYINTLFDWGPHDLSLLLFFINEPCLHSAFKQKKYRRVNYLLKFNNNNQSSLLIFGNNFKNKKRNILIETNKNTYEIDLSKRNILKKNNRLLSYTMHDTPLQNLLNSFYKKFINKKKYNDDLIFSINLTNILTKVEKNV